VLAFSEIVLDGNDAQAVLDSRARVLQKIIDTEKAQSWLPDLGGGRPFKIE
jgi:hypothetical protein